MDKESFLRLRGLKAQLEASTEAEVVRRALKAYEIFEPSDDLSDHPVGPSPDELATANKVEHLYVRIPQRTKDRLDFEQEVSGRTYSEQVRQALRVLTQLINEADALRKKLAKQPVSHEKGEDYERLRLKLAASC